jgi:predicted dehydrogenase
MKLRSAIIGAGYVASRHHLPAYKRLKHIEIVAVCDRDYKRASRLAKRFGIPRVYENHSELLQKEDVDFVDVCTPVFTHMQICSEALDQSVNVLVEKPLCLTSSDAIALERLRHLRSVSLCVVHNYRFLPPVLRAEELIKNGKLGQIASIVGLMRSTPLLHLPEWTWDESRSGGIFFEAALHLVDLQVSFCGEHLRIIGLTCKRDPTYGFVQEFQALIEYKSGAIGTLDVNFNSTTASAELDICGTGGGLRLIFFPPGMWRTQGFLTPISRTSGEAERVLRYLVATILNRYNADYHLGILRRFVESVANGSDPPVSISSIIPTIRLLEELRNRASATPVT